MWYIWERRKWKSLSHVWLFVTPMVYTVHGFLQARILKWVAFPFSRGSSQPRDQTQVSCMASGFFISWAPGSPLVYIQWTITRSVIMPNKIMPFATTWMDLETVILSEVSHRRRNIVWHSLYVASKKKWYKWTYKTKRDRLREQTYGCRGEG